MIYTKTGDDGSTALYNQQRYKKSELVFEVLGTIDELNSCLGFLHIYKNDEIVSLVKEIQKDLFTLGSLISGAPLNVEDFDNKTVQIEAYIDKYSDRVEPLRNFVLPGGSLFSGYLNVSRSICRRLERILVLYNSNLYYIKYINRLSDLLFILARYVNKIEEIPDVIWKID